SHDISPSANMFFARSASRLVTPASLTASWVMVVSGIACTWKSASEPSSSGFVAYPALSRLRSVNASELTINVPPFGRSFTFVFSAAGFIATSTFGRSPGVRMSWSAKWIWKPETPGSDPAGARISAGKSGSVERSFPSTAVSLVNRAPVSCIPSPESPAKRIVTWSTRSTALAMRMTGIAQTAGRRSPCFHRSAEVLELGRFGEQRPEVERRRVHLLRPLRARPIAVELDAVPVRIAQVDRLADAVVGGPAQPDPGLEHALHRTGERLPVRAADRDGVEPGRPGRRRRAALRLPGVQRDVVVVAAGGEEDGLLAVAVRDVEAEHAVPELERPIEVGDLEVDVTDVDARVDAHRHERSR